MIALFFYSSFLTFAVALFLAVERRDRKRRDDTDRQAIADLLASMRATDELRQGKTRRLDARRILTKV